MLVLSGIVCVVSLGPCTRSDSLVSLRPLPAAQPESSQQLVPAQENKHAQSEQREDDEEDDQQTVSEGRVFICRGQTLV